MRSLSKLISTHFYSSSSDTPQFLEWYYSFKKEFESFLKTIGATEIEITKGHFYVSGFFRIKAQLWYFSISDVRGMNQMGSSFYSKFLIRTAEHNKDWTGGRNQFAPISNKFKKELCRIVGVSNPPQKKKSSFDREKYAKKAIENGRLSLVQSFSRSIEILRETLKMQNLDHSEGIAYYRGRNGSIIRCNYEQKNVHFYYCGVEKRMSLTVTS